MGKVAGIVPATGISNPLPVVRGEQIFMAGFVNPGHFTAAALAEYVVENPPAGIVPKIVRDPESVSFSIFGLDSVCPWPCESGEIQHSEPACGRDFIPDPSGIDGRSGF